MRPLKRKTVHFNEIVFGKLPNSSIEQQHLMSQDDADSSAASASGLPTPLSAKSISPRPLQDADRFRKLISRFGEDPDRHKKTNEYVVYIAKLAVFLDDLGCDWDVVQGQVGKIIERHREKASKAQLDCSPCDDGSTNPPESVTSERLQTEDANVSQETESTGADEGTQETSIIATNKRKRRDPSGRLSLLSTTLDVTKTTTRAPRTLEALKEKIKEKDVSERTSESWIAFQDMRREIGEGDIKLQEDDYYHIGELVFCRMFGETSKDRLYCLLAECEAVSSSISNAVQKVEGLADRLAGLEYPQLASLVKQWGSVVNMSTGVKTASVQIRIHIQQYELWKKWIELKELYSRGGPEAQRLQGFLQEHGFVTGQGKGIDSCLASYFTKELGLEKERGFSDTIYQFTAVGILVDILGLGVLVFLPKNIDSWYRQLRAGRERGGIGSIKRKKIELVCGSLAKRVPFMQDLCNAAKASIVDRVLADKNPEITKALQWIQEGKSKRKVMDLPLLSFVEGIKVGTIIEVE